MYGFQVLLGEGTENETWVFVAPANGAPYKYDTAEQAQNMADMCYPYGTGKTRVKLID